MFSTLSRKVALETRDSARSHGLALPIQSSRLIRRSYTFREIAIQILREFLKTAKRPRRIEESRYKKRKKGKKKKWKTARFKTMHRGQGAEATTFAVAKADTRCAAMLRGKTKRFVLCFHRKTAFRFGSSFFERHSTIFGCLFCREQRLV